MLLPLSGKISSFQSRISLVSGAVSAGVRRSGTESAGSACVETVARADVQLWPPLRVRVTLAVGSVWTPPVAKRKTPRCGSMRPPVLCVEARLRARAFRPGPCLFPVLSDVALTFRKGTQTSKGTFPAAGRGVRWTGRAGQMEGGEASSTVF